MSCRLAFLFGFLVCFACSEPKLEEIGTDTLFTLLPAEQTNIDFTNQLTYTEEFNPYTYRNFYNGGGVGLGDINNDGLLDIYFCGNQVDSKLYLNKGNWKFEDITDKAGVACHGVWASGVAFVDINGDGWQDIYVCKSGKPGGEHRHNELFINQKNNTFKESAQSYGLDFTGLSSHAAFFDFDRDGDLDCYLLNNSIRPIGVYDLRKDQRQLKDTLGGNRLLRNDNGRYTDVSDQAGIYGSSIGFGLGVSVGDLNGDTWPDLYISNDFFERDYLYYNNQKGGFTESLETSMAEISLNSMGADIADLDNDARPEVFVTDMLPETDARYKTKTTFENWEKYRRNVANGYHHQFIRNALQWNRGSGKFSEISRYAGVAATDWSWGALLVDLDMDGWKDIFVANGIYKDLTDQDYLNLYNDSEAILGLMKKEKEVIRKLIDAIPSEKLANYAFQNQGDLTFKNQALAWGLHTPSFSHGSAYGDLDNDGDPDLVVNNTSMPSFVYRNNTNAAHNYLRFELKGQSKNSLAIGTQITLYKDSATFFQEVYPMRGFESCVDPRPLFGLGKITELDSVIIRWPLGQIQKLERVTVNQAIRLDEREATFPDHPNPISGNLLEKVAITGLEFWHRENDFNDFERDRLLFQMYSTQGPALAVSDLNGDGLDDVFVGGSMGQAGALFIQTKVGTFIKKQSDALENDKDSEDTDAIFFDADRDGDNDLYVCSGGNEVPTSSSLLADRLYLNDGKGNFRKSNQLLPTFAFESTSCVRPHDIDDDGDMDLFVGVRMVPFNYGIPCSGYLLENNGQGSFTPISVPALTRLGLITDAAWADLDADGSAELIICGEWMPITVLKKRGSDWIQVTDQYGLTGTNGWWQTIQASDLDADGDIDLIGGNWGLNARLHTSPAKPLKLYINDFDQNGTAEQLLTMFEGDQAFPLTLRQDLLMQLPYLKKKYLEFKNYRNQTIDDIFTPEELSRSIQLVCNTLYSTTFIQDKGHFRANPLPMEAQLAPIFGTAVLDLNHDQKLDIVTVGNFSAVKPELGSLMAGGIALSIQKENGSYLAGMSMMHPGEFRAIQSITINKKKYLLIAANNGPISIWKIND
jgi:enediyne biosynthesis protein E4